MTEPDYYTRIVMDRLADAEQRIAAGEITEGTWQYGVRQYGRVTLIFGANPDLHERAAEYRRWLAEHAYPVELRAQWKGGA